MPTKRTRNRGTRKNKSKRGGIPFIPGSKFHFENVSNCKNYWSENKEKSRCEEYAKKYDYPGYLRSKAGHQPMTKDGSRLKQPDW